MTSFDIFNPQISTVAKGLEGKVITIVGSNNLGKTKQATRMERPYYIGFEKGLRAIAGIPFLPVNKWTDFKKINKQLTDPKTLSKARELYQTIIFDEVYTSALYCQDYLCKKFGVETIGDGNEGYGLWKEYETEYWTEIDKLLNSGYTLIFISHEETTKEGKKIPKGDKRSIKPIIDNSDVVVYLQSNGIDENNKVIKSSAWFAETPEFFARSRFDYMTTFIPEFTAENLEAAIAEGIRLQEEAEGIVAVSYNEQKESYQSEALDFDAIFSEINEIGNRLASSGYLDELLESVERHLGKGKKVGDVKPSQVDLLSLLLIEVKELAEELNV
ncbi:ATP-binding protein [Solibacillus sp. FSL H8-0523]|uniref:ATP-binding protein n=1 Tax=Solibacillus sp. FSL H8-0523 TaxID=2954511 RepID=UPI0031010039